MGRKALDVLKTICDQLGWTQITTVENEDTLPKDDRKLVRALNRTLRVLSGLQDWRFLRADGEIITTAEYNTGLARMTNESTAVTGQDDPDVAGTLLPTWTVAMVGRAFFINGVALPYRISAVNSATSLTLDRAWQGDTTDGTDATPDLGYRILQDRYEMPLDMDRPVDDDWTLFKDTTALPVKVVDATKIKQRRRRRSPTATLDDPEVVTIWRTDSEGEHRVAVLDPFPKFQRVIQFEYQRIHPTIDRDTQRVQFPPRYEEVVIDGVEFLLRSGPEDDARAELALGEYLRTRTETASAREVGERRRRLSASQYRVLQQKEKWLRRGVEIDWGSRFDDIDFFDL